MTQVEVDFRVSAPGKVILIGEHSVVYKKRGIAASVDKRTYLSFREHKEAHEQITFNLKSLSLQTEWDFRSVYNLVTLDKPLLCDIKDFSLNTPEYLDHDKFVDLVKDFVSQKVPEEGPKQKALVGVFYAVLGMLWCTDINISPFDIDVSSNLTIGAGTGSSASFAVCVVAAIYNYIRLKAAEKFGCGSFNISNVSFKPHAMQLSQHYCGFSPEEKETVNKWAFCLEKINHLKPSGIDNTVCTFGNAVLLNENDKCDVKLLDNLPSFHVLLVNTGVSRSTSEMLERVSSLHKICPEALQSILDSMDVIAMKFMEYAVNIKKSTVMENILQGYRQLEVLIDLQQGHLRTLGVSHPRLDEICFITKRRGMHSKLTGAGGGGNAITLVPPDVTEDCVKQTMQDLRSSGFLIEDIKLSGEGLTLDFK